MAHFSFLLQANIKDTFRPEFCRQETAVCLFCSVFCWWQVQSQTNDKALPVENLWMLWDHPQQLKKVDSLFKDQLLLLRSLRFSLLLLFSSKQKQKRVQKKHLRWKSWSAMEFILSKGNQRAVSVITVPCRSCHTCWFFISIIYVMLQLQNLSIVFGFS